jgi:hypothetical protein
MKRIIRLTESDLVKLVKRVIKEERILDDLGEGSTTLLPKVVTNIKNELEGRGFKYNLNGGNWATRMFGIDQETEDSVHIFQYNDKLGNNIEVKIDTTNKIKPYLVISKTLNPNWNPSPGLERDTWDKYIYVRKEYSENEYPRLLSDIKTSMNIKKV